jgi:hypothetical protein
LLELGDVDLAEGTQKLIDLSKVSLSSRHFTGIDKQIDQELKDSLVSDIPVEHLANRKLHALFELWDSDGDGAICFEELCQGLTRFKPIHKKQVSWVMEFISRLLQCTVLLCYMGIF